MESLNLYDQTECNQSYFNNLCELENIVSQYIQINNINTELLDRIICKIMMNDNYDKVNILIVELNRLLKQYYLPYYITILSSIKDLVKVEINDIENIEYKTIECSLTIIDATAGILELTTTINNETTTTQLTVGNKVTIGYLDLIIEKLVETNFSINIEENTLITLTYNNVLQELNLYILNLNEIEKLEENYNQQNVIQNTTSIKEKLECHKQYLIEKMDLICKFKKKIRGHQLPCNMIGHC